MKVIVDNKIPYIKESIEKIADEVIYLSGTAFTPEIIRDADALVIRTRTRCNQELLQGSRVKFIATATIGFDHIDTEYCRRQGIEWKNARGSNASSVAQYIYSSLLLLQARYGIYWPDVCLGIVGVGNVGSKVKEVAESLGMKVLLNDPPRAERGEKGFTDLDQITRQCDLITFHTPLNRTDPYKTFHLGDSAFFSKLAKRPVIINTSRGEVLDTQALKEALDTGKVTDVVLDVWEHEPDIDLPLLKRAFIGTPHIAGYSADGKANATRMALEALCHFFRKDVELAIFPPPPVEPIIEAATEAEALLKIYNPETDTRRLKEQPGQFEYLRGHYPFRREAEAYSIRLS